MLARLVFEQLRHAVGADAGRQPRRGERQQGRKRVARRPAVIGCCASARASRTASTQNSGCTSASPDEAE